MLLPVELVGKKPVIFNNKAILQALSWITSFLFQRIAFVSVYLSASTCNCRGAELSMR